MVEEDSSEWRERVVQGKVVRGGLRNLCFLFMAGDGAVVPAAGRALRREGSLPPLPSI